MAHRTTKPDSKKHDVVHFEVKKSAATGDVEHERRLRLSDRDLQVLDLKAAGALSCSYVVCVSHTVSCDIKLAQPLMHHAPYRGRCQASHGRHQKVRNPSHSRIATLSDVTRHHTACMTAA